MKKVLLASLFAVGLMAPSANAADYIVDYKGAHASVNFKIQHLGYSWLTGRFDKFSGHFSYDANNVSASKIEMLIDTSSINSNHGERDKHLRGDDFLDTSKYTQAKFVSTSIAQKASGDLTIKGDFTLHGVTKAITIDGQKVGEGKSPWGDYRVGFSGTTKIALADFGIKKSLGPKSAHVELEFHIEGVRQ